MERSESPLFKKGTLISDGLKKMARALENDTILKNVTMVTVASGYVSRQKEKFERWGFVIDNNHPRAKAQLNAYRRGLRSDEWGNSNVDEQDFDREPAFAWTTKENFISVFGAKDAESHT